MKRALAMLDSPRCTATSKRTGQRCRAPAVRGWHVCRSHGARGGAPKGPRNGAYKHGLYSAEAISQRRALGDVLRWARAGMKALV